LLADIYFCNSCSLYRKWVGVCYKLSGTDTCWGYSHIQISKVYKMFSRLEFRLLKVYFSEIGISFLGTFCTQHTNPICFKSLKLKNSPTKPILSVLQKEKSLIWKERPLICDRKKQSNGFYTCCIIFTEMLITAKDFESTKWNFQEKSVFRSSGLCDFQKLVFAILKWPSKWVQAFASTGKSRCDIWKTC
jgi:hypothetical protein